MFEFDEESFAIRLKKLIKARGMTQEAFAEGCGIPLTTLGTYFSAKSKIGIENAIKIAEYLSISLDELLLEKQENTAKTKEITPEGIFDAINYLIDAYGKGIIRQGYTIYDGDEYTYLGLCINDSIVEEYLRKIRSSESIIEALKTIEPETYMQSYRLLLKKWANTDALDYYYTDKTLHYKDELSFLSIADHDFPFN